MFGAVYVIRKLEEAGYEAYIVGGAVRDSLMGKTPKDYDVATNATPDQMRKVFPRNFQLNNAFGTVTVQVPRMTVIQFGEREEPEAPQRPDLMETIRERNISLQELMTTAWRRGPFKAPEADPEGDKILAYWERKMNAPGYKVPYADLTFEQRRAKLGPKKKKNWRGGGHAP